MLLWDVFVFRIRFLTLLHHLVITALKCDLNNTETLDIHCTSVDSFHCNTALYKECVYKHCNHEKVWRHGSHSGGDCLLNCRSSIHVCSVSVWDDRTHLSGLVEWWSMGPWANYMDVELTGRDDWTDWVREMGRKKTKTYPSWWKFGGQNVFEECFCITKYLNTCWVPKVSNKPREGVSFIGNESTTRWCDVTRCPVWREVNIAVPKLILSL